MIPKLEFTAESWPEEYRAEVVEALDKHFDLNGNEDIRCHPHNANGHIYAFKGYENYRASLLDYGYADTAYKLIQQTTYPSWNYMFSHGATTMTEAWSTYYDNEDGTYTLFVKKVEDE